MTEILNLAALWRDKSAFADYCRDKLNDPHYDRMGPVPAGLYRRMA